jgi:hypothetical protein
VGSCSGGLILLARLALGLRVPFLAVLVLLCLFLFRFSLPRFPLFTFLPFCLVFGLLLKGFLFACFSLCLLLSLALFLLSFQTLGLLALLLLLLGFAFSLFLLAAHAQYLHLGQGMVFSSCSRFRVRNGALFLFHIREKI